MKRIQGIDHPVVHVYAVCWNEEKIIPFFLSHYNEFVDHYYIYDNYSDDKSDELLSKQSNISVIKYDTGGTFNDIVHQQIKNTAWKQSRGKADWVIVIDMDELIYHPNLIGFLNSSVDTVFNPSGFNMVTDKFPQSKLKITEQIQTGIPDEKYTKMILFNPHRIVDINYMPGAHEAYPEGIIRITKINELKLLHYKNLGVDYVLNRIEIYRNRLSETNRKMKYGIEYEKEYQKIIEEFNTSLNLCKRVID
ncbi:MAG: glycosyltransferase family 2 protein [Paludibacter sp.]|nr:glycosyltransferase family 2 protein [Paludibacter sp.]